MNPQDCVWEILYHHHHEDHIAGKGEISLQHYNLVHKFIPYASSFENSFSESSGGQGMGKIGKKFRRGT